jgi:rod shape determining protein RodA
MGGWTLKIPELDRRLKENFNWKLLLCLTGLVGFGLINLYSISGGALETSSSFARQAAFVGLGYAAVFISLFFDYRILKKLVWPVFVISLILLLVVQFSGVTVNGATRWLQIGGFRFQPSEMVKFTTIVALAAYLSRKEYKKGLGFKDLLAPALLLLGPTVLIAKQPDVGTALQLGLSCVAIFLFRNPKPRVIATFAILGFSVMTWVVCFDGLNWLLEHKVIKSYHIQRYNTFLAPEKDPNGKGWQIIQSKSAIGSGQINGRGFMSGSQQKYGFLPEADTDFAFSALAEEWGFVGAIGLLSLFFILLYSMIAVVLKSGDTFGALLVLGLTSALFWQITLNVAMCLGLFPVVGIPLPFISYGGTSLLMTIMSVGVAFNVGMRRYLFLDHPIREGAQVWLESTSVASEPLTRIRRLLPYDPKEPEHHPAHRLPHCRPWLKHMVKKSWVQEY